MCSNTQFFGEGLGGGKREGGENFFLVGDGELVHLLISHFFCFFFVFSFLLQFSSLIS